MNIGGGSPGSNAERADWRCVMARAMTAPPLDAFEMIMPRPGRVSLAALAAVPTVIHLFTG